METETKKSLSARFEEIKYTFKLSNSDLAKIAGVSGTAIGDIVNGVTDNPKVNLLTAISQHLKISLSWLATGDGQMIQSEESSTDDSVLDFFRQQIQEKDRQLFEIRLQLFEKDKIIAQIKGRVGKRRGVSSQPGLTPLFA